MSQVILENVYKSFSSRKGESVTSQNQSSPTLGEKTDAAQERAGSVNVLRRINLTIADGEFMVLVGPFWLWEKYLATVNRWVRNDDWR